MDEITTIVLIVVSGVAIGALAGIALYALKKWKEYQDKCEKLTKILMLGFIIAALSSCCKTTRHFTTTITEADRLVMRDTIEWRIKGDQIEATSEGHTIRFKNGGEYKISNGTVEYRAEGTNIYVKHF